jgi:hypothetical protein
MRYMDGNEAMVGDVVAIDTKYRGVVVACMDRGEYLPGREQWAYLKEGIMVDTDFGGLVHYTTGAVDEMALIHRAQT